MRKKICNCLFTFTVVFTIAACNDPIFFTIYQEVKPIDPRIMGAPSNFVIYKNAMYVASSDTIHRYDGSWGTISPPGGRILKIASTDKYLYALCYNDHSSGMDFVIKRFDGNIWETLGGDTDSHNSIQYIFAAGGVLFIGAETDNVYSVLYIDENDTNKTIKKMTLLGLPEDRNAKNEISGASIIGTDYYISTIGDGIFKTSNPASGATLISDTLDIKFISMINLNSTTIALITRDGHIYTSPAFSRVGEISLGNRFATGALAVWENKDDPSQKLLLAGRQDKLEYTVDSGYTYGYMELELNSDGTIKSDSNFMEPGKRPVTTIVDGNERYISTIGKYPVNHIFQATDGILFASTQKNGVWSYRDRSGGYQWNAEE